MFELLHSIGSKRWHLILGALTLAALLTVPATPAQAQELVVLEGEETEDSDSPTARADRDSSQRFYVRLVGTISASGGTGSRVGTVTVTLRGQSFDSASQTYEVELPDNASRSSKDRFLRFVRDNNGRTVYLRGHLHGGSPRNVMHVTSWSSSHSSHSMWIEQLVGQLINPVCPGGECTRYAVRATHNGNGSPIQFLLRLSGGTPIVLATIRISDAPVIVVSFTTTQQFVIAADHWSQ